MQGQPTDSLARAVVWCNILTHGAECCELWRTSKGWSLRGNAIAAPDHETPLRVEYEVHCDASWRTRRAHAKQTIGADARELSLEVDADGVWRVSGKERTDLRRCVDIDLGITPATNTLPIRRLNLAVGESQNVTATWVRFPELTVELLPQRYTRLAAGLYRYESGIDFFAEIAVDDLGLVIDYSNGWQRLAAG